MTPASPWWLLTLSADREHPVPFTAWMLWHYHCLRPLTLPN